MMRRKPEYETCMKGTKMDNVDVFSYCLDCYMKQDCTYYDTSYEESESCEHFGNRLLDYPKCGPCPGEKCEECSIITLQKVLSGHSRRIDVITSAGFKLVLNEGEEKT